MTMQSRRLPGREFDAGAFDQADGGVRGGQLLFQRGSRLRGGKRVSAMAIISAIEI